MHTHEPKASGGPQSRRIANSFRGNRQIANSFRRTSCSGESVQCRSGESLVQADLEILLDKGKDLGTSHKFKKLIDNQFRKDNTPKSVFLWRLGSNMCRITGHTDRCRVDFAKLIAPKFFVVRC